MGTSTMVKQFLSAPPPFTDWPDVARKAKNELEDGKILHHTITIPDEPLLDQRQSSNNGLASNSGSSYEIPNYSVSNKEPLIVPINNLSNYVQLPLQWTIAQSSNPIQNISRQGLTQAMSQTQVFPTDDTHVVTPETAGCKDTRVTSDVELRCENDSVEQPRDVSLSVDATVTQSHPSNVLTGTSSDNSDLLQETSSSNFCVPCNMQFDSMEDLLCHKEERGLICRVCILGFEFHNELETHFFTHRSYKCKSCKKIFFYKKDLIHHKKTSSSCNIRLICDFCSKTFISKKILRLHQRTNHSTDKSQYKCVVCGKTFFLLYMLNRHLLNVHVAFEYKECKLCHSVCLGAEALKRHIQKLHLYRGDKNYSCSICRKVLKNERLLKSHEETHDETVILCEICKKPVLGKGKLKSHMRYEHTNTGSFTCEICNKQLNTKQKFSNHLRTCTKNKHLPVECVFCDICGKVYKSNDILRQHKVIHRDERPFKCEICSATFKYSVSLKSHGKIHNKV